MISKQSMVILGLALGLCSNTMGADIKTINKLISRANTAKNNYHEAQQIFDRQRDVTAQENVQSAKETYEQRISELDRARIETLAEYSGVALQAIERRHAAAASWTAIAREIGVHPSVIGIEIIDARPPPFADSIE